MSGYLRQKIQAAVSYMRVLTVKHYDSCHEFIGNFPSAPTKIYNCFLDNVRLMCDRIVSTEN